MAVTSKKYVEVNFVKSIVETKAERSYGKIDDLLAYIGGFFSLIFFVLVFFCGSYNEYRYELMASEHIISYNGGREGDVR